MGYMGTKGGFRAVFALACAVCLIVLLPLGGCGGGERADETVTITIESAPENGASVIFLQERRGETPLTIPNVKPGPYDVFVEKEYYKSAFRRVLVTPEDTRFTLEMEPRVGFLSIESTPTRVDVYFDDAEEPVGITPLVDHPLIIGEHTYTLRLADHYEITESISVEESFRYTRRHELRAKEATLEVHSTPTGASVYVNNSLQERTTPMTIELRPDTYLITIKADGHVEKDERVTLKAAENHKIEVELKKGEVPPGMVLVPAGEFIMGASDRAPDEAPERKIHLDAYFIDKFAVTNEQFQRVFPNHAFPHGLESYPVAGVSWEQATTYARAVGKRLPTEAEWEKAARGTDGREYPWGNTFEKDFCNTVESGRDGVHRVDAHLQGASPFGCINMAGNVFEWVQDWYQAYPGNKQVTKDYGQVFRVLRGGSYRSERFKARCAHRHFDRMDAKRVDYGFRCAMDAK